MITIIDYNMGNLRSVQKAFEYIGKPAIITADRKKIMKSSLLVLPGVGAFDSAMKNLKKKKLVEPIKNYIFSGKPFLGICLGLQVLFEKSEEGKAEGLGILKGCVKKILPAGELKIPHMGWNNVKLNGSIVKNYIFSGIQDNSYFYFVHSYFVVPCDKNITSSVSFYGTNFVSSVFYKNIFATQFHPEKSQNKGLKLLRNYADYTGN
ncbi:MAG: Imidazole glycerol phosphate synthase subunit HisH 1 [Elusimicrobia bacterium ADurb.Bin231]|nr:MAG: Imidazole glycerol phosphate synthase subunit HisH 1 [Elusimicrobia bacterium ADurb.Bin231]